MKRPRRQTSKYRHFGILVNASTPRYDRKLVQRLTDAIHKKGGRYTIFEPDSPSEMLKQARAAAGLRKGNASSVPPEGRRSPITALIAVGGDSSFNLVARAALEAEMPLGLLPTGAANNIAKSLIGSADPDEAISRIIDESYRQIDIGMVGNQPFYGSIGIGLLPKLLTDLGERPLPRFAIGWSKLAGQAAADYHTRNRVIRVDSFRFEVSPTLLNVNLLPYAAGLKLSPVSIFDDGLAEVIFDTAVTPKKIASFCRQTFKGRYQYGSDVRLYRGKSVSISVSKGEILSLDGELIELQSSSVEVKFSDKRLKVLA